MSLFSWFKSKIFKREVSSGQVVAIKDYYTIKDLALDNEVTEPTEELVKEEPVKAEPKAKKAKAKAKAKAKSKTTKAKAKKAEAHKGRVDLEGQVYENLVVLAAAPSRTQPSGRTRTQWKCMCVCGKSVTVDTAKLRSGKITACKKCRG